jgi:uncharacterized protein YjbJ (UPF0337 family)
MKWEGIAGDWGHFKGLVKNRWSKLDAAQLDAIAGRRDRLLVSLEEEYGITRGESEGQLEAWQDAQD